MVGGCPAGVPVGYSVLERHRPHLLGAFVCSCYAERVFVRRYRLDVGSRAVCGARATETGHRLAIAGATLSLEPPVFPVKSVLAKSTPRHRWSCRTSTAHVFDVGGFDPRSAMDRLLRPNLKQLDMTQATRRKAAGDGVLTRFELSAAVDRRSQTYSHITRNQHPGAFLEYFATPRPGRLDRIDFHAMFPQLRLDSPQLGHILAVLRQIWQTWFNSGRARWMSARRCMVLTPRMLRGEIFQASGLLR